MADQKPAKAATGKAARNKKFKKRERKNVPFGLVHIQATFNNTIVTITDQQGNTLSWKSSGSLGFRGSRKGTPFAAQQAAMNAANMARDHGVRSVDVRVRAASPRFGRWRLRASMCGRFATSHRFRTMGAGRRRDGAFKQVTGYRLQVTEPESLCRNA